MPSSRRVLVGAAIVVGLLLTFVAGGLSANRANSDRMSAFERDSVVLGAAVEAEARALFGRLADVGAFLSLEPPPTRREFRHYLEQTELRESPLLNELAFIERVRAGERDSFLEREQADDSSFVLKETGQAGEGPLAVVTRSSGNSGPVGLELVGLSPEVPKILRTDSAAPPVFAQVPSGVGALLESATNGATGGDGVFVGLPARGLDGEVTGWVGAEITPGQLLDQLALDTGLGAQLSTSVSGLSGTEKTVVGLVGEPLSAQGNELTSQREFVAGQGAPWLIEVWSQQSGPSRLPLAIFLGGVLLTILCAVGVHLRLSATDVQGRLGESERRLRLDTLTGLPNRFGLEEALNARVRPRRERSAAALFVDVDRFKLINDSLGHAAGDEMLVALAERLRRVLPEGDVVGRFGGDEFLIVTGELDDPSEARDRATSVLEALGKPLKLSFGETRVHASVGLRLIGPLEGDIEGIVRDADLAMFEAKRRGGGQVELFGREMRDAVDQRLAIERALTEAVPAGDLHLEFQPIVDAAGSIGAVEGLTRWTHPELGDLSPKEFLPIAEEIGLMPEIGRRVVAQAIDAAADWNHLPDRSISVAVNVSAVELRDPRFPEFVRSSLEKVHLPAEKLVLEISEEIILESAGPMQGVLAQLYDVGVGLAIDDFGTGRSSLGQAGRLLGITEFKLDRSLVAGVDKPEGRLIVKTAADLAAGLGQRIVAEGVETVEQRDFLTFLGVNRFQGFLFAPAVPRQRITAWLAAGGRVDIAEPMLAGKVPSQPSS